jgi:dihydroneopterin aldolase
LERVNLRDRLHRPNLSIAEGLGGEYAGENMSDEKPELPADDQRPEDEDLPVDADDEDDEDDDDDDVEGEGETSVSIDITGLSVYTHHGVTAAEREIGQRLVLDVRFDVGEPDALITDRVEDTIDYGEVCQVIALIAQQRSYKTLERLCAVIADRLATQFGAESVTVKAAKPEPPIPLPVEEVSVEVWREERP